MDRQLRIMLAVFFAFAVLLLVFSVYWTTEAGSVRRNEPAAEQRLCVKLNCENHELLFEPVSEVHVDPSDPYRSVVVGRLKSSGGADERPSDLAVAQVSIGVDPLQRGLPQVLERESGLLISALLLQQLAGAPGIAVALGSCQNGRRATATYWTDALSSTATRPLNVSAFLAGDPPLASRLFVVDQLLDILDRLHQSAAGSLSLLGLKASDFLISPNHRLKLYDLSRVESSYFGANCSLLSPDELRDGQCQLVNGTDDFPAMVCPPAACRGLAYNVFAACRELILPLLDSTKLDSPLKQARWSVVHEQLRAACRAADVATVFAAVAASIDIAGR